MFPLTAQLVVLSFMLAVAEFFYENGVDAFAQIAHAAANDPDMERIATLGIGLAIREIWGVEDAYFGLSGSPTTAKEVTSVIVSVDPTVSTTKISAAPTETSSETSTNTSATVTQVTSSVESAQTSHGSSTEVVVTRVTFTTESRGTSKVFITETLTETEPCSEGATSTPNDSIATSTSTSAPVRETLTKIETETLPCSSQCASTHTIVDSTTTEALKTGTAPVSTSSPFIAVSPVGTETLVKAGSCEDSDLCTSKKTTSIKVTSSLTLVHTAIGTQTSSGAGFLLTSGPASSKGSVESPQTGTHTATASSNHPGVGEHQPSSASSATVVPPTPNKAGVTSTSTAAFNAGNELEMSNELKNLILVVLAGFDMLL